MNSPRLPFEGESEIVAARIDARDRASREHAVDPRFNVALEASAGTGKTRVLVDRYVNLLRAGVEPRNVLAITFTRKAAAEMRERIMTTLRLAAARGEITPARWRELRDRTADIAISTIDAFCLSLLREFPLEADLDPGFSMADDTEVPRLIDESLDRALRVCRSVAEQDEHVALVFAQLGERRTRAGLAVLLNRRIVAPGILARYQAVGPRELTVDRAVRTGLTALLDVLTSMPGGIDAFIRSGPADPAFVVLVRDLRKLQAMAPPDAPLDPPAVQAALTRLRAHFLTQSGEPRSRMVYAKPAFRSAADWQRHRDLVVGHAPLVSTRLAAYRRDLNVLVARGVSRMFGIAETAYRQTLEAHAVLDFSDVLVRALGLLRQMEEFAQSRYRLEARYHHVLVDEFQDTSRAQWELVSLLVQSWGEGAGLTHSGPLQPSIFIVGDRKQSIYRFRDADASILGEASRYLDSLRPEGQVRRAISRSFRSTPALLRFVNDLCHDIEKMPARGDGFRYDEEDRFPVDVTGHEDLALGLVADETPEACATRVAYEVARLLAARTLIRDKETGLPRELRPGDIAILFRTRESHRLFEDAIERRGIPSYVYKGLGFFDADEIKDVIALLWFLAEPSSDLRVAAWLRSRVIGMSDEGLRLLAPYLADALRPSGPPHAAGLLDSGDRAALDRARAAAARWLAWVDRLPPAEVLDRILSESAYTFEIRGARFRQARENLKKIRTLIRRIQNRGYATVGRVVAHLDRLAVGDEANASIDARDAVNLMTVHASKGLEFPVVFVVNLSRGTGNRRNPIRVALDPAGDGASVAVGDFESEADEDEPAREREETKRLLYVALTRARDRLYLSAVLKEGRVVAGRGSLADVLPASLLVSIAEAMTADSVAWHASSGGTHVLRGCAGPADAGSTAIETPLIAATSMTPLGIPPTTAVADATATTDYQPLPDTSRTRRTALEAIRPAPEEAADAYAGTGSDRLVGTLVHRLIQRTGLTLDAPDDDADSLRAQIAGLLRDGEVADVEDVRALVDRTAALYRLLIAHPDVRSVYGSGDPLHEVPFAMVVDDAVVRGTIDCIVRDRSADGRTEAFTVLEFKTGRPRPEHEAQAGMYRRAVENLYPEAHVEARLIYVSAPALT